MWVSCCRGRHGRAQPVNQSLQKTVQILDMLMKGPTPIALTDLARGLEMPKSTVSRFLATLEAIAFVRKDRESGKYYLGLRLFELGCKAIEDIALRKVAIPEMEKLRDHINETIVLTVMEGTKITYLDRIESQQAIVTHQKAGETAPAYCVSSGKVMIAYDEKRLERVIQEGLTPFTPLTIIDPDVLRQECAKIRKRGYAINRGEHRLGVTGVAAPIFNANGTITAAISTATPATRMNRQRWRDHVDSVTKAASAVSRNLGYRAEAQ
jgi:IclR family transcriptional regulator, KDG regulon repressor